MMDRFDSSEPAPEWHPEAFREGQEARSRGLDKNDLGANPYFGYPQHWMYKSFVAGWCDEDQLLAAPSEGRAQKEEDHG